MYELSWRIHREMSAFWCFGPFPVLLFDSLKSSSISQMRCDCLRRLTKLVMVADNFEYSYVPISLFEKSPIIVLKSSISTSLA